MATPERVFAWGGGLIFVLALAVTAWTFAVTFATNVASSVNWRAAVMDALAVTAFAAHHSLFARTWMKDSVSRYVRPHLLRSVYVYVASALLVLVCLSWRPVGGELFRLTSGWMIAVCSLCQLAGVALVVWAARVFDPLELAGIHSSAHDDELRVKAPYTFVRHPIYLGWILVVFGSPHLTGDRLVFASLTTLYLVIAIPWEERGLVQAFGAAYERYRRQVRWRVLPGVY